MDSYSGKLGNSTFLKNLLTDPLPIVPQALFWDTSLPASAIFQPSNSDRYKAVIEFLKRLIKEKTVVAFSSVLFDEFIHISIRNEMLKAHSKSDVKKALNENNIKLIEPHISNIQKNMTALQEIISKFKPNLFIINPSEGGIIKKSLELRIKYNLQQADSIHLATMLYGSQRDIACFDKKIFVE